MARQQSPYDRNYVLLNENEARKIQRAEESGRDRIVTYDDTGILNSRLAATPFGWMRGDRRSTQPEPPPSVLIPSESDLVTFNNPAVNSEEYIVARLLEDLAGTEIINIARSLTINGQNTVYQPIRNASFIQARYSPWKIVTVQGTSYEFFENFAIRFVDYIPNVGTGPNGEFLYLEENGDLVINVVNIKSDEMVEVEIISGAELFNDTIYTEEES